MKLAAIYNVWDGVELLQGSIDCIKNHVDLIIIIYQKQSNYGEEYDPLPEIQKLILKTRQGILDFYEPDFRHGGSVNETCKRNRGLQMAKIHNCTHFLHMDCDEYYKDFGKAKEQYIQSGKEGSVCKLVTYFKSPCLQLETPESYYVPFIHKLNPDTTVGIKNKYTFYADPTRRVNCDDVILIDEFMHHYSYVRKDIERKIRNSSAKVNLEKSTLLQDYKNPECKEGYYLSTIYKQKLIACPNYFNIEV